MDTLLKSFTEAATYDIQYQPLVNGVSGPAFIDCATIGPPVGPPPPIPTVYTILGTPSPTSGAPGTVVTLFGTGYAANSPLTLTLSGTSVSALGPTGGAASTDANGDFTLTFKPLLVAATYTVKVTDGSGYSSTSPAGYTVTSGSPVVTVSNLANYTVQMTSIEFWNNSTNGFDSPNAGCSPADRSGIQRVRFKATAQDLTSGFLSFVAINPETTLPAFTSVMSHTFTAGEASTFTVSASGYPSPALTNASAGACVASSLQAGLTFADNGDGTATVATTSSVGPGIYTLCITASNSQGSTATPQTVTINVVPATLVFTTQPGGGLSGTPWGGQPVVAIQDAAHATITSGPDASLAVTLAIASQPSSGAALTCTANPQVASGGVASFSGCQISGPVGSNYTLVATASGTTGATSSVFSIGVGPPAQLVFTTQPGGGANGSMWSMQPVVAVEDSGGNVITSGTGSNASVKLAIAAKPGNGPTMTCSSTKTVTASAGVATFAGCQITGPAGSYTLSATVTTPSLTNTSAAFTITVGPATQLAFTPQPGGGMNGSPWSTQPKVSVEDSGGNVVTSGTGSSASVVLAIASPTGNGAMLSCSSSRMVSASAGVATFAGCQITGPAVSYTLSVTVSVLSLSNTSASFGITVGPAAQLVFTGQPGGGANGSVWSMQPQVTVEDSGGNVIASGAGANAAVTLAVATQPAGGGSLTCTSSLTVGATAGVATFAGCTITGATGSYTLSASASGFPSITSNTVSVSLGPAAKLAFTVQPSGGTNGVTWATSPQVTIEDVGGNAITSGSGSNAAVTLAIASGPSATGLSCTPSLTVTATSGVAAFSGCQIAPKAGSYTLSASAPGLATATSNSFAILPGAPVQLLFTTQPGGGQKGKAWAVQPVVSVADSSGNVVTTSSASITIAITPPTGGAILSCTANPLATTSGMASFANCMIDTRGNYTLSASAPGYSTVTSNLIAIT